MNSKIFVSGIIALLLGFSASHSMSQERSGEQMKDPDRAHGQDRMKPNRAPMQDGMMDRDRERLHDGTAMYGSELMTEQERLVYREQIRNAKTEEERNRIKEQHRNEMLERAREQKKPVPTSLQDG